MWHTMTAAPVAKVTSPNYFLAANSNRLPSSGPQLYARPDEDFSEHANVHKLLGHMVDSGVAAGYEEEAEGGDQAAGRRWGRPPKKAANKLELCVGSDCAN